MSEQSNNKGSTVLGRLIPKGSHFATLINEDDVYFWIGMDSTKMWIERDQIFAPSSFTLDHYLKYWPAKIIWSLKDGEVDVYKQVNKTPAFRHDEDPARVPQLPKSEFERKYIVESDEKHPKEDAPKDMPVATVDFGSAVYALKQGKKVARSGWNGKGMYIRYVPTTNSLNEHLEIKNVKDTFDTWVPSISDLLAEDWVVL